MKKTKKQRLEEEFLVLEKTLIISRKSPKALRKMSKDATDLVDSLWVLEGFMSPKKLLETAELINQMGRASLHAAIAKENRKRK